MEKNFSPREDLTRQLKVELASWLVSSWLMSLSPVKIVLLVVPVRELGYKSSTPNSICLKSLVKLSFTWATRYLFSFEISVLEGNCSVTN